MQLPEEAYLESRIYTASPWELVQILYETALDAVREAIEAVKAQEIERRSRAISRASSCVMELAGSLNVEAGGELGVRLAVLYEYLLHRLLEANVQQSEQPLRDCERVIASLLDGWALAVSKLNEESGRALPEEETMADEGVSGGQFEHAIDGDGSNPDEDAELCETGTKSWSA